MANMDGLKRAAGSGLWASRCCSAIWIWTALSSWVAFDSGLRLLAAGGVSDPGVQAFLIHSGASWDLAVGVWLWAKPGAKSAAAAFAGMLAMSLAGAWLSPALLLDPLGPLSKNLALALLLSQAYFHGGQADGD